MNDHNDDLEEKLELTYPVMWGYRVIGSDETELREAISEVLEDRDYTIAVSNRSSTGKYIAINVELIVYNETERTRLYVALKKHPATEIIL